MPVNVLGTPYEVYFRAYDEDPAFVKNSLSGYCSFGDHTIVICRMETFPGFEDETDTVIRAFEKEALRHELVHAFLYESGLCESASPSPASWAKNEEMVDWFALQGPKIFVAWQEAGAL